MDLGILVWVISFNILPKLIISQSWKSPNHEPVKHLTNLPTFLAYCTFIFINMLLDINDTIVLNIKIFGHICYKENQIIIFRMATVINSV